jgi:sterol desaturase/sphingolipid hydroxylase (fatty acid hydroxylase superfamily)
MADGAAVLQLVVPLGALFLVMAWEWSRPRRQQRFPALPRRLGNVGFWLLNLLLAAVLLGPPDQVRRLLEVAFGTHFVSWPIGNRGLSLLAGFLFLDLMRYAVHRCEHAVPLFWRFHALHHSDPDVDVTTSVRHHPFEYVLASVPFWLAAIVFDMPAVVLASYGLAVFASEALQHGNISLPVWVERCLQPVLVTTNMHRIHHSVAFDRASANYGAVLSVWDRLFGSYVFLTRAQHRDIVFGVRALPSRECIRLSAMLMTPWLISRRRSSA